jgi:multidrug efflux pump subunit AcrA (membrane-fusion protein)
VRTTLIAPLVVGTLAIGCTATPKRAAADLSPAVAVSTARVEFADLPSFFDAGGVVRARVTAPIASRVLAPISAVHVRIGDRVRRGDRLVTLDAREVAANRDRASAALTNAIEAARAADADVLAAEAAVKLADTTHQRVRTLQEKRSATLQELDQAVAARDAANAQLTGAQARVAAARAARDAAQAAENAAAIALSYMVVTAPFDGIVTERAVDPGSLASPGQPLLTLEDATAFRLEVPLDDARAGQVTPGQTAAVELGEETTRSVHLQAHVVEIGRVDPAAHSFLVKLNLPSDPHVHSGLFGRARFDGPTRRTLVVPESAEIRRGQLTFVFVVDAEGRARLQPVSPGGRTGGRLEVLAGVHEGDRVITQPPAAITDGTRVSGGRS